MNKAPNSLDVAAYIIEIAKHENAPISQLPLQKLVVLCQSAYVHRTGGDIFSDPVLAYKFGPVTRAIRWQYMDYGKRPIDSPRTELKKLTEDYIDSIVDVWSVFAPLGSSLVRVTHDVGPWLRYRTEDDKHAPVIPNDELGEAWPDYVSAAKTMNSQYHDSTPANYRIPDSALHSYDSIISSAMSNAHELVVA